MMSRFEGDRDDLGDRAPGSGPELAGRLGRGLRRAGVTSNSIGGVVLFLALVFVGETQNPGGITASRFVELLGLFGAVMGVAILTAGNLIGRSTRLLFDVIEHERPVVGDARDALLRAPWMAALTSLAMWALGALAFSIYGGSRLDFTLADTAQLGLYILLAGFITTAVVYLLTEGVLRPAFALAFRDEPPIEVRGVAVGRRLLLSWVLGAGVPLLAVATVLLDSENARLDFGSVQRVSLTFVGLALLSGVVITWRVARSVTEPLGSVRDAMTKVAAGDLRAEVAVDDATEVGLLQAGFNRMVAGLRERERLRDLFGRHVGEEVARQALDRGIELGGEVRTASVLFVDLAGSTSLAETRPPGDVVTMLNDFFHAVVRASETEGGWVNKFEGDAALCVFGVPVTQPDHALRALRAARALRKEIEALRERYPEVDAGIGVCTGEVLAGNVGAERRYEYTVIGDPVNEAARLTEEAKLRPGRVLASEAAVRAAGEESESWRRADVMPLRGRTEPTITYEPT